MGFNNQRAKYLLGFSRRLPQIRRMGYTRLFSVERPTNPKTWATPTSRSFLLTTSRDTKSCPHLSQRRLDIFRHRKFTASSTTPTFRSTSTPTFTRPHTKPRTTSAIFGRFITYAARRLVSRVYLNEPQHPSASASSSFLKKLG
jgi:hypothetical protein